MCVALARGLALDHSTAVLVMRVSLFFASAPSCIAVRDQVCDPGRVHRLAHRHVTSPASAPAIVCFWSCQWSCSCCFSILHSAHSIPLLRRLALAPALVLVLVLAPALRFPSALFSP